MIKKMYKYLESIECKSGFYELVLAIEDKNFLNDPSISLNDIIDIGAVVDYIERSKGEMYFIHAKLKTKNLFDTLIDIKSRNWELPTDREQNMEN
jgi:hypothetical protein